MTTLFFQRRSVVMNIDVVGYCRMMGRNEQSTLARLLSWRHGLGALVSRFGGRIVDATGDNVLAEFPSESRALRCAIELQREALDEVASGLEGDRLRIRVGVHSGDVLERGAGIYGDVVNVACRLQSLAEPDGILVSGAVAEHLESVMQCRLDDLGERRLRNTPNPTQVLRPRLD